MNSSVWKGVAAGLALFLVVSGVALFTPARTPVLKVFGRDYAALRLEAQQARQVASAASSASPRGESSRDRQSPAARLATWEKRAEHFSAFGFVGWLADLWPWLVGFGVALPVLGGLIGAQAGGRRASSPVSSAAMPPAREPESEEVAAPGPSVSEAAVLPESLPAAPIPPPTPPETWNWNAKPASRMTPSRPKPPPVQSPNADSL